MPAAAAIRRDLRPRRRAFGVALLALVLLGMPSAAGADSGRIERVGKGPERALAATLQLEWSSCLALGEGDDSRRCSWRPVLAMTQPGARCERDVSFRPESSLWWGEERLEPGRASDVARYHVAREPMELCLYVQSASAGWTLVQQASWLPGSGLVRADERRLTMARARAHVRRAIRSKHRRHKLRELDCSRTGRTTADCMTMWTARREVWAGRFTVSTRSWELFSGGRADAGCVNSGMVQNCVTPVRWTP